MINEFNKIQQALMKAESVLLVGHPRPDGDCLGALSAMADYLISLNKKYEIILDEELPNDFDFLAHTEKILVGMKNLKMEKYDTVLVLDAGDIKRTGIADFLQDTDHPLIIEIDHHVTNRGAGDINAIKNISSTCEVIYDFFQHVNFKYQKETATALLTGILTDTGLFAFANTSGETVKKAAALVARGADFNLIKKRMFNSQQLPELKFLGKFLSRLQFNEKLNILFLVLTKEDLAEEGAETDILSNFLQQNKEAEITMVLKEGDDGMIKVSWRSKKADVARLAKELGGGGHKKAAAFLVKGKLVKTEDGGWKIE
ncbi:MAG: bifunctional oligoribonuclease/PAP phosphatase NrnA [Patescibacteria group bacterium]|nr:bifunctional oligoribonuclease/PAP phosphatase NrnA [Patescibacteria group bacterium]